MEIYVAQQTIAFLQSCLVGMLLGVLYDFFRISRIAIITPAPVVFAEDVVFFLVCGLVTFLFMLGSVDGTVRLFLIVGEFLGAVIYSQTLSVLVMKISKLIIRIVYGVLNFIFRFIFRPIWHILYAIIAIIIKPFYFFKRIFKKMQQKLKFSLKVRYVVLYNQCRSFFRRCNLKTRRAVPDGEKTKEP